MNAIATVAVRAMIPLVLRILHHGYITTVECCNCSCCGDRYYWGMPLLLRIPLYWRIVNATADTTDLADIIALRLYSFL